MDFLDLRKVYDATRLIVKEDDIVRHWLTQADDYGMAIQVKFS